MFTIMSLQIMTVYILLSSLDAFISSSCLTTVDKTSTTMLSKCGESKHSCSVSDLKGKAFSFCQLSMMLAIGLSYMALIMLRFAPSIPNLLNVFIINGAGFFQMLFSHILI